MTIEVLNDAEQVAVRAAEFIAAEARRAIAVRGRFIMALSGGNTPWKMLRTLSSENLPWEYIHIFQVDERIAPDGDLDRNLTHLKENLITSELLMQCRIYPMPVGYGKIENAPEIYENIINDIAGNPSVIDLVHLGLGTDGHTASLIPGDPVLEVRDRDVALTRIYQGRKRMTLTYPVINRSRMILWIVTGSEKCEMLQRMLNGDKTLPAGRVSQAHAVLLADSSAAENLNTI